MRKLLFVPAFLFFISGFTLKAATCIAISTGDWEDEGSWSVARTPTCGDSVVIPVGITITIADQEDYTACGTIMKLNVLGTLTFASGKKLTFSCGSLMWIQGDGSVTSSGGGGSSNLITICGVDQWNSASGPLSGPASLPADPMPIELSTFYALPRANKINIHWETATETNNKQFDLDRSTDGINFTTIATINSKGNRGNSLTRLTYDHTDADTKGGTTFYRLKQTDYNGAFKIFQIISVQSEDIKNITFTVYPNPNQGEFTVDFTGVENNHTIEIIMYDQTGKLVYTNTVTSESLATNTFWIIPQQSIAAGNYIVNFVVEGIKYPVKVIVK